MHEWSCESSNYMTGELAPKPRQASVCASRIKRRVVLFLLLAAPAMAVSSSADAQRKRTPAWPFADSAGESDVYPTGDAVGVYRAVLDLLYIDGSVRPSVIVLWDTATRQSGGPCAFDSCPEPWLHKSRIDTTTLLSFARTSPKRPRVVDFGYRIPIVRLSMSEMQRIRHDGYGYLANRPPDSVGHIEAFWAGFTRKYPRAWGYAMPVSYTHLTLPTICSV